MSRRQTPIDKMRELADDGLEPWQIAAALGVREDAVLVALAAVEPAGGAQRAVEDALSLVPVTSSDAVRNHAIEEVTALAREMADTFTEIDAVVDAITPEQIDARLADVISSAETWGVDATQAPMSEPGDATTGPSKPDTLAPTRPMTQRLAEHVAVTVCGPETIDESGGAEPYGHDHEQPCDLCDVNAGTCCGHCSGALAERLAAEQAEESDAEIEAFEASEPDQNACSAHEMPRNVTPATLDRGGVIVCLTRCYACQFGEHMDPPRWHSWADPDDVEHATATGQPDPSKSRCGCDCAAVEPEPEPEHVHDPFPVVDEAGVWHAQCECGTRWDRASCDTCGLPVTALHIAQTGLRRHKHHPAGS